MAEIKLPDVGEGLTEAEIVSRKVKEGDTDDINDIIDEIDTANSLVELTTRRGENPVADRADSLLREVARRRDAGAAERAS